MQDIPSSEAAMLIKTTVTEKSIPNPQTTNEKSTVESGHLSTNGQNAKTMPPSSIGVIVPEQTSTPGTYII